MQGQKRKAFDIHSSVLYYVDAKAACSIFSSAVHNYTKSDC